MARFIHKTGLAAEACISSQALEEGNPSPLSEVPVPGCLWHGWSRHLPAPGAERHAGQVLVLQRMPGHLIQELHLADVTPAKDLCDGEAAICRKTIITGIMM